MSQRTLLERWRLVFAEVTKVRHVPAYLAAILHPGVLFRLADLFDFSFQPHFFTLVLYACCLGLVLSSLSSLLLYLALHFRAAHGSPELDEDCVYVCSRLACVSQIMPWDFVLKSSFAIINFLPPQGTSSMITMSCVLTARLSMSSRCHDDDSPTEICGLEKVQAVFTMSTDAI